LSRVTQYQSNFTVGELDPLLVGRVDIQQYASGLSKATNVVVLPQGGFERRPGSKFLLDITTVIGSSFTTLEAIRLVPFEFSTTQSFMFCFVKNTTSDTRVYIFADGVLQVNINGSGNNYLTCALGDIDLNRLYFTQSADTLILVHEDMSPKSIVRGASNTTWTFSTISLTSPKVAFSITTSSNFGGTITPDAIDGTINITASNAIFNSGHVDQYINVLNGFGRARIIEFIATNQVSAVVEVPFFKANTPIADGAFEIETGYEDAWSASRGYPRTCSFHEGRLYFGGSKSLPNTLFGSKVADFFNFKIAEALDDDAILVTMNTDSVNAITAMRSGRDLQIFTKDAEFFVPQADLDPITPSNIVIKNATRRGSKEGLKPVMAEGGTLFIQREGKALREFLFSDVDLNYQANNISLLASHLLKTPRAMALRVATSTDDGDLLLIPNDDDGSMAVFSILRSQNVVAPAEFITDGNYLDVAVDGPDIYTVVERPIDFGVGHPSNRLYVEIFDDQRTTDSSVQYYSGGNSNYPDQNLPSNTELLFLSHLKGVECNVLRDNVVLDNATPDDLSGNVGITIDEVPTSFAEVGVPYTIEVTTLPAEPKLSSGVVVSRKRRILEVTTLVDRTQNIAVNGTELAIGSFPYVLGTAPTTFTGRKRLAPFLGYTDTASITFTMTQPLFATVLAVEYKLSTGQ
tara:strand:+ start:413 stop:2482 length:2070 start_codon:yes stop_codon:yes gene_type:complete